VKYPYRHVEFGIIIEKTFVILQIEKINCKISDLQEILFVGLTFQRDDFREAFSQAKAKSKLNTALKNAAKNVVTIFFQHTVGQFHQHFRRAFFVQKLILQLFTNYRSSL